MEYFKIRSLNLKRKLIVQVYIFMTEKYAMESE